MKILYVISTPIEYSSSANMRNLALIKGLMENGHEVDLVSDSCDTNSKYVDETLCAINFNKRYYLRNFTNVKEIKCNKKNNIIEKIKLELKKIIAGFSIYDNRKILVRKVKNIKFDDEYDILISSSDPKSSHLIAKEIIKRNPSITRKWIQYWGDPFATDINKSCVWPTKLIEVFEKRILNLADEIVYVSPFTLDKQKAIYLKQANKMRFLPVPYMKEKIYPETGNEIYTVGYFGDYKSKDRDIVPLYNAVECLNIKFNICGNSDIVLNETDNIKVCGRKSQSDIEKFESKTDLLVVICNRHGTQIPGKLYHYAATNKPILVLLDGTDEEKNKILSYINKFNRYEVCNNNENEIFSKIVDIIEKNSEYQPLKELTAREVSKQFIHNREDLK